MKAGVGEFIYRTAVVGLVALGVIPHLDHVGGLPLYLAALVGLILMGVIAAGEAVPEPPPSDPPVLTPWQSTESYPSA